MHDTHEYNCQIKHLNKAVFKSFLQTKVGQYAFYHQVSYKSGLKQTDGGDLESNVMASF